MDKEKSFRQMAKEAKNRMKSGFWEKHKEEVNALTNKLNEQTLTVQKLVDKIDELLRGLTNENK